MEFPGLDNDCEFKKRQSSQYTTKYYSLVNEANYLLMKMPKSGCHNNK